MQEVLKELIAAVGGGAVVLVGVLTIFKKLFLKLFETGIESTFEKELEKYRNKLSRADRAFEILLNREMHYYEKIKPIFAEIVPLEHDLFECLKIDEEFALDFDVLGYLDPNITVCIIKDGKLVEKKKLQLPQKIINVEKCKNPRCITSVEQGLDHVFYLANKDKRIYRCLYCETKVEKK